MKGRHTLGHRRGGLDFGGFKHNYQSLRIVDLLEKRYDFDGLNLTAPVREGILKHTGLRRKHLDYPDFETDGLHFECDQPTSLEGQVVAICDEIAQRTHDLEDGIRADLVDLQKVRRLKIIKYVEKKWQIDSGYEKDDHLFLEKMIRGLINLLIDDVLQTTMSNLHDWFSRKSTTLFDGEIVGFSAEIDPMQKELNKFIYKNIIDFSRIQWSDELGGKLVSRLFEAYYREPGLLPDDTLTGLINNDREARSSLTEAQKENFREDAGFFRIICDYIAGMTDYFALKEAERLAEMHKIDASDLHIDYALGKKRTDSAA
jgi:dGTPase